MYDLVTRRAVDQEAITAAQIEKEFDWMLIPEDRMPQH
jgi:hypothetical protein